MEPRAPAPLVLALDTASPVVSVALATASEVVAERSTPISGSSRHLLAMVDEVLEEGGTTLGELTGLVALRGPGSFTGLRVGLATVLGLHQALGTAATAVSTLETLATAAALKRPEEAEGGTVVAVVDVLRGEWAVQPFAAELPPRPLAQAERLPAAALARFAPCTVVGFALDPLHQAPELAAAEITWAEPPPLAAPAALSATRWPPAWEPRRLTEPLYFRPPAVTLPRRRPGTPRQRRRAG